MRAISCTVMRGGTSKGLYFLASDLPSEPALRDNVLLVAMGSPDSRQIDGMGGAHPLTSKVAIVSASQREDADVDYLFLQVAVDKATVSSSQNCGNLLAGVGPFALEQGLLPVNGASSKVRIHMVNTGSIAVAHVDTSGGKVRYEGESCIDGVPGTAAPVVLDFLNIAGSSCGQLLPTGAVSDTIQGKEVTCIDNGMPVVVLDARDFGLQGIESPEELEKNATLRDELETIRLDAGKRMNLGDVVDKTVPKMSLLSAPRDGGLINTRTFIPHRVHEAIGVLGAVSVASACLLPGSIAQRVCGKYFKAGIHQIEVEHPTGSFTVELDYNEDGSFERSALLRTARKLMQGDVFISAGVWGS